MGTFDGVHRGHRAIIKKAVASARALGCPSLAMTFHHPPRLFFHPSPAPSLLTLPSEKETLLKSLGIDRVVAQEFGGRLAALSAETFYDRTIRLRWRTREIVVGYNFHFGHERRGNAAFLEERSEVSGIPVHVIAPVTWRGSLVSSGAIREHLKAGELTQANAKLGYEYFVTAPVVKGEGLGRRLGFPTANLAVPPEKIVPYGVFAVRVFLPGGGMKGGMANVGFRPTLREPHPRRTVEVNVFGFKGSLVGKTLRVSFVKKLREEKRFPSLDHLKRRLRLDADAARAAL
jgi:riboflavin kinase/FMN adenylyltransferase